MLVGHTKAEVFEMVRDLDLPLEQGNIQLLKKLQALGLHANRSDSVPASLNTHDYTSSRNSYMYTCVLAYCNCVWMCAFAFFVHIMFTYMYMYMYMYMYNV